MGEDRSSGIPGKWYSSNPIIPAFRSLAISPSLTRAEARAESRDEAKGVQIMKRVLAIAALAAVYGMGQTAGRIEVRVLRIQVLAGARQERVDRFQA
jgi:hypothetical protein